jgi:hypothetical protein
MPRPARRLELPPRALRVDGAAGLRGREIRGCPRSGCGLAESPQLVGGRVQAVPDELQVDALSVLEAPLRERGGARARAPLIAPPARRDEVAEPGGAAGRHRHEVVRGGLAGRRPVMVHRLGSQRHAAPHAAATVPVGQRLHAQGVGLGAHPVRGSRTSHAAGSTWRCST